MSALGGKWVGLNELMAEADFVTIHCPLNRETRGMVGAEELALMKPSAFLINMARGGIIDEAALCRTLQQGKIAGAALDVIASEPPAKDHPLFKLDNVLWTPHLGAVTLGSFRARRVGRGARSHSRARKQTAKKSGGGRG